MSDECPDCQRLMGSRHRLKQWKKSRQWPSVYEWPFPHIPTKIRPLTKMGIAIRKYIRQYKANEELQS